MKLYKAIIAFDVLITAKNEGEAESIVKSAAQEELLYSLQRQTVCRVISRREVPTSWLSSIPYGTANPDDLTVREIIDGWDN